MGVHHVQIAVSAPLNEADPLLINLKVMLPISHDLELEILI